MRQEDFILREIEKIGVLLQVLFGKLMRKEIDQSISIGAPLKVTKEMLFDEIGFDLEHFMRLEDHEFKLYLDEFNGLNIQNREHLARVLKELGEGMEDDLGQLYLKRSLQLLKLCSSEDKTYSYERERLIEELRQMIKLPQ